MVRKLDDTITIDFCTHNPETGAVSDADSLPTCEVFEDSDDTSLNGITVTKRTGKTGDYRVQIVCTQANGFDIGKSYNAVATATVNTITAKALVCSFTLDSVRLSDLTSIGGGATASEIADAVWNETASDHTTSGSFGTKLNDLTVSVDPTEIAAAV